MPPDDDVEPAAGAARAEAMAWICADVRFERELMLPTLPMAAWIWVAVLPDLVLEASG
jgi:hypothetical protein